MIIEPQHEVRAAPFGIFELPPRHLVDRHLLGDALLLVNDYDAPYLRRDSDVPTFGRGAGLDGWMKTGA
ncbi:hypothetical protein, partial [Burkholderia contaminans]|uniref:hypothetical protein n=1 Tax=Burkholderia contaminans TaxID=488447 RepID=UPI002D8084B6